MVETINPKLQVWQGRYLFSLAENALFFAGLFF
jgi:hypothetical protein